MWQKLAFQILLASITPKTVALVNRFLIQLLQRIAEETDTELDDKLVELLSRFLKDSKINSTLPKPDVNRK